MRASPSVACWGARGVPAFPAFPDGLACRVDQAVVGPRRGDWAETGNQGNRAGLVDRAPSVVQAEWAALGVLGLLVALACRVGSALTAESASAGQDCSAYLGSPVRTVRTVGSEGYLAAQARPLERLPPRRSHRAGACTTSPYWPRAA
jgi:hypothetical protein